MSRQNSSVPFFAGLVMGGMVGAGLTLLLAPQSGQETRSQISAKSVELKEGAVEGLTEASQRAQAQAAAWQETLETGKHSATEAISHSIDNLTQAVTSSKDRVVKALD